MTINSRYHTLANPTFRLPVPFKTILVEFQMVDGDIISFFPFIISITIPSKRKASLAAVTLTYEDGVDRNDQSTYF